MFLTDITCEWMGCGVTDSVIVSISIDVGLGDWNELLDTISVDDGL